MADILSTIKQAAVSAVAASNPLAIMFGNISKINPLEVIVDQRFTLPADFLIVPESLTELTLNIAGNRYTVRNGLTVGDKVLMLRLQGGQQFVVLDRVVK